MSSVGRVMIILSANYGLVPRLIIGFLGA